MKQKHIKKTHKIIYLILLLLLLSSIFVIFGMFKYLFVYNTSFVVHFLFVASGAFFLFCTIILILEMMEEEGLEYTVTDKGISMARLPFFYTCTFEWNNIKSLSTYNINSGNKEKKFYLIKDNDGNELSLGDDIADIEGLIETICQKTSLEAEEIDTLKEYSVSPFYFYKPAKEKSKNSEGWRLKVYNFSNILLISFLLIAFTIIQSKAEVRSEEVYNIILYVKIIMGLLILAPAINLIFYKIWQKKTIAVASKVVFFLINIAVVLFSACTIIALIYFYNGFAAQLYSVYPLLVILLLIFIFYPLGNLNAIMWLRKLKKCSDT